MRKQNIKRILFIDKVVEKTAYMFGVSIILLIVLLFVFLLYKSRLSIKEFGIAFLWTKEWDPVNNRFGALPFLITTLITSFSAIIITTPLAIGTAIFVNEYINKKIGSIIENLIYLLAGIPSVVYGLWGIFVLIPIVRNIEMFLFTHFSNIPIFNAPPYGVGIFSAIIILSIMILPYYISIATEVIKLVPKELKEGSLALGSTKSEMIHSTIVPFAKSGFIAGMVLALGRAIGETMAVTMVIGNSPEIPKTLFDPANTLSSVIANEFSEATSEMYLSSIIELGLVLFFISLVITLLRKVITDRIMVRL